MKTNLFYLCLCLLTGWAKAQEKTPYNYFVQQSRISDSDSQIKVNAQGDTILVSYFKEQNLITKTNHEFIKVYKGTPFFKNGWYRGEIPTDNGKNLSFVMAYNIQQGVVHLVHNPEEEAASVQPTEFSLDGHTFKQIRKKYYETIYAGESQVLKEYQCVLRLNAPDQRTGYEAEGGAHEYEGEYYKAVKYYLKKDDKLKVIPPGRKVFKLFGTHGEAVQRFVKTNQLNPDKEKDLAAIFNFFDSL